jgi:hypothetical protein
MAVDEVKLLYLKVNEDMTQYELDGRNSQNAAPDFFDIISTLYNDKGCVVHSRVLPESHYEFAVSLELAPSPDYIMSPERAKALISNMKPRIAKIVHNYEQSGNGDGMAALLATKGIFYCRASRRICCTGGTC